MFEATKREKFFFHNTLLCLVRAMQGQKTTVDLRNDSYICGEVNFVDGYMNMTFSNAIYCDPQGNEYRFEKLFIQARNIRYVHIPEKKSIESTIKAELSKHKKEPVGRPKEQSRKVKKALRQHLEVVASLNLPSTSTK